MKARPWTMLHVMLAGWINRHQQDMIDYLKADNAILKEKIGKKRIILSDQQRRTLAVLAKKISRKALNEICDVFSPDTLLKWHRALKNMMEASAANMADLKYQMNFESLSLNWLKGIAVGVILELKGN
ncbi:MAG: hypothetical protein A2Y10_18755 [Planctomycetes bacterium GWF2_41_51]|nr:MAG: hypothetical protein A2Y10_18755 [Planctomycetes bacterium GWF2_41_51]HBG27111.1 hypothetical protein [Phycisphaerales bacterium]